MSEPTIAGLSDEVERLTYLIAYMIESQFGHLKDKGERQMMELAKILEDAEALGERRGYLRGLREARDMLDAHDCDQVVLVDHLITQAETQGENES